MVDLAEIPDIVEATPKAKAPWLLTGNAYVSVVRLPETLSDADYFVPSSLTGSRRGLYGLLMFVDYTRSDVGPYHEILFIPGNFQFADGRRHLSISRIFVSTWDSVVNGQINWGIPKDRADFRVEASGRHHNIQITRENTPLAELHYRHGRVGAPVHGGLIPKAFRTLAQVQNGQTYLYTPSAHGLLKPARLLEASFNSDLFPDLNQGKVLATVYLQNFRMTFPVARILGPGSTADTLP